MTTIKDFKSILLYNIIEDLTELHQCLDSDTISTIQQAIDRTIDEVWTIEPPEQDQKQYADQDQEYE